MGIQHIKSKHLVRLGFPKGSLAGMGLQIIRKHYKQSDEESVLHLFQQVLETPEQFLEDPFVGPLAEKLMPEEEPIEGERYPLRDAPQNYNVFGLDGITDSTQYQMDVAMRLPVAEAGALMPDAHKGYGLPVGGVLATRNAVIPYAVGMDIGCRMCLSILDLPVSKLDHNRNGMAQLLKEQSRFGKGVFDDPMDDPVLDSADFDAFPEIRALKDTARRQIGTSGGGNHFVEFGRVVVPEDDPELDLKAGTYLGLLTHSGSRGFGASLATHYTKLARQLCRLPKEAKQLAWLDLNSEAGQEYWIAMNLAGDYASACHQHIHQRVMKALGAERLAVVENHHNFAWKEQLADGTEVIVHRKGATPAHKGEMGIIPGSMTAPGFVVRGKGNAGSLNSASHGAGRRLSRKQAMNSITRSYMRGLLDKADVTLIGGGPEEAPGAYKNIEKVMAAQTDLVDVVAAFHPVIVRMDKN